MALEGARLRLRTIIMTSFAFILDPATLDRVRIGAVADESWAPR